MKAKTIIPATMFAVFGTFGLVMGFLLRDENPGGFSPGLPFAGLGLVMWCAAVLIASGPARYRGRERRRSARVQAWAAAHGWTYQEAPLTPRGEPHAPATRLRLGADRLLETSAGGVTVAAAESSHLVARTSQNQGGSTTSYTTAYAAVFALRLAGGPWPDVDVRPKGGATRLIGAMFHRPPGGIHVGYGDFDARFTVASRDPYATRVFSRPLLDAHLAGRAGPWRLERGELIVTYDGRLDPDGIGPNIDRLRWLASLLARPA